ncbi:hypothetical protein THRCLA_22303 [Thraustotheca clavata]|uniref:Uncharacterized protein n=1 Tax=Thraustotheca clavata TaxID=74557 RepID=A0A1V9Z6F1_9STRA|nr:hypothetical protein THRCLA_22303 [Thraustotheca clavata]
MDAPNAAPVNAAERWNFVQMNMSLLPIACPLPVHTSLPFSRRNDKPRTPIHQVVEKTLSISPRRQGEIGHTIPVELSLRECVLRKEKRGVKRERNENETMMIQSNEETQMNDFGSVKVKRILEILDQDRTSGKEDSMHAISPRKKCRTTN